MTVTADTWAGSGVRDAVPAAVRHGRHERWPAGRDRLPGTIGFPQVAQLASGRLGTVKENRRSGHGCSPPLERPSSASFTASGTQWVREQSPPRWGSARRLPAPPLAGREPGHDAERCVLDRAMRLSRARMSSAHSWRTRAALTDGDGWAE
jgi:hypothetical protein